MRTGRLVDNHTNMSSACATLDWIDGREVVAVVVKATFEFDAAGNVHLPLAPAPIRRSDTGEWAATAAPIRPDDIVPYKPGTEVLLVGSAVPNEASASSKMSVSLRVVNRERVLIDKSLDVYGPRRWKAGLMGVSATKPGPIQPTPLIWENAYGGSIEIDGEMRIDPRNPVGRGVGKPEAWLGQPLPMLEDPQAPLSSRNPAPAGFGPIQPSWQPRRDRYGTIDEKWQRERAPLPPVDIDLRSYCCAPDDQWVETPLVGGELFEVTGMRASGPWQFRLPMCQPLLESRSEGVATPYHPHVDTVLIDVEKQQVELSWHVAVPLPQKTEKLERISVHYAEPLNPAWIADLANRQRASQAPH